jgi:hypothetical protein
MLQRISEQKQSLSKSSPTAALLHPNQPPKLTSQPTLTWKVKGLALAAWPAGAALRPSLLGSSVGFLNSTSRL